MTGVFLVGIGDSQAAPGDRSSASGTFLSGSLLGVVDPVVTQAQAQNLGTTATQIDRHSLDVGLIEGRVLQLPANLGIPLHLADAGALGSYAKAEPTASSVGASGLVGNDGAVGVGSVPPNQVPGNLTLDLHDIIGPTLAAELADLHLDAGAMSARAESVGGGVPSGTYEIAGGKLRITSNTLKGLNAAVTPAVNNLQTSLQGTLTTNTGTALTTLQNSLSTLLGSVLPVSFPAANNNASISLDLASVGTLPQQLTTSDGSVSIDLATGEISADLSKIGGGLNGQPANTEVLSATALQQISGSVLTLVGSAVDQLQSKLNTAVRNAAVTMNVQLRVAGVNVITLRVAAPLGQLVDGTAPAASISLSTLGIGLGISLGAVTPLIGAALAPVLTAGTTGVGTAITNLRTTLVTPVTNLLQPALTALNTILSLKVNVKEPLPAQAGRPFSQTALRISLLNFASLPGGDGGAPGSPGVARTALTDPGVLFLDMANAEVGQAVDGNAVAVPPRVDSLSPTSGPEAGGTVVTINGAGFNGTQSVTFGGTPATVLTQTDTQLTVKTPFHVAGAVPVIVTTGSGASQPGTFTYVPGLALTTAVPNVGPIAGGTVVTLTGSCLDTVTGVTFGGTAGTIINHVSAQELTVSTPAHAAGAVDVTVTGPAACGTSATLAGGFTFQTPQPLVPAITGVAPQRGPETGGQTVVITGSNFTGASAVTFDGVGATAFTVNSPTQITATTPPHAAGTIGVAVTTPVGTSGTSPYVYEPVIAITAVTPGSGPTAGNAPITIDGRCFTGATSVDIGGAPATNLTITDTRITATTPAGAAGPADVVVHGSTACYGDATAAGAYSYVAPAKPVVTDHTPIEGPSTGGTTVLFTGTGFTGTTGVQFGGVPATDVQVISDTALRATTAARTPGLVTILVQHPNGDTTIADGFTYTPPPAPTVSGFTPTSGPTAGGTEVTITGTGFTGSTGVTFDGAAGTAFVIDSDTQIRATTPAHAAGPVTVAVQHPSGDAAAAGTFTYEAPPVPNVTQLSPASGTQLGGTLVTITGTNLGDTSGVTFDGLAGTLQSVSATQVTVLTPAHAPGPVDAVIQSPSGDVTRSFTYLPDGAPSVTTHTPTTGPTAGGTLVTIDGADLDGVTAVEFDGLAGTIQSKTATQITVLTPGHATGAVDLVLRDPAGDVTIAGGFDYRDPAAPTIATVDPTTGTTAGGTVVTITGSGFLAATGVTFGGDAGTGFTVVSDTEMRVSTPAHAAGGVPIVVQHPDGTAAAGTFTFTATPPTATAITPNSGSTAGGEVVTITGTAIGTATSVAFGADAGTAIEVVGPDTIRVTTPAHAAGTVSVVVTTPDGQTAPLDYTYVPAPPTPTIGGISPVSGPTTGGTAVTITGTGFTGATGVTLGGTAATGVTVVNDTTITATTPAHAAGAVDVVVTAPGGTATLTNGFSFQPGPAITGLTPTSGGVAGGTSVTIIGSNLTGTTAVSFGGTAAAGFTVDSDSQITATTPAHAAGAVDVQVTTPIAATTSAGAFTYLPAAAAASVSPASGPDTGEQAVTITGTGFTGATGVTIGGTAATNVTVVSDTQITATTPAHTAGVVDVVVQHPAGDSTLTGAYTFVSSAPPTATSFTPTTGSTAGGTTVTITGTGFIGATGVTFGGTAGTSFQVVDDTTITVSTPAHAAGDVTVVVQHPNGTAALADPFTYTGTAPSIQSVSPATGPAAGSTTVTISGPGLGDATGVTFGGLAGTTLTRVDADAITVVTPAHSAGTVDVVVTLPTTTLTQSNGFEYTGAPTAPTASSITPATGSTAGGTTVEIAGTGFTGATAVTFDGTDGTSFQVVNDTLIRVTTPVHAAGNVAVVVEHPNGDATVTGGFDYTASAPSIDGISPADGPAAGNTTVTITGPGLGDATGVTFGGTAATDLTRVDDDTITVVTPTHAAGPVDVVVTLPTTTLTATNGFEYTGAPTAPTATGITPANGAAAGGTTVDIAGTGFTGATGVTFDGTDGTSFQVVSDSLIRVTTPAHAAGNVAVMVEHPNGDASVAGGFTYDPVAPSIQQIAPTAGPADGGTTVTITGPGVGDATGVTFGGNAASTPTRVDANTITVITPAHAPGAVDVIVTLPTATLTATNGYTFAGDAPAITDVTPSAGPAGGGTTVTIGGTGLTGTTEVQFGGTPGTDVTVVDDSTVTVVSPPHLPGNVHILLVNPKGDVQVDDGYGYVGANDPVVTGVSQDPLPTTGGRIRIFGRFFTGATGVTFDGVLGSDFAVIDDNTIEVTAPPHAPGRVQVRILTATGGSLPWEMEYVLAADPGAPGDGSGPSSSAAGSGGLAATGTDGGRWVFGALAMLFAGAALLLRGARRRRFTAA
ncbi:IPT/TIG domain-containing protein [Schumannella sp. 10F1B-5-1]|uniref:IPT/TIG domain-containing protein n=1 Tax=Schumannella sp. 10F1B-5-1 TaxID=2590780 RepID=UPI002105D8F6|nr:IPT/TIG domain-containing protein [Schumannella sp. 10F1B-5-1]